MVALWADRVDNYIKQKPLLDPDTAEKMGQNVGLLAFRCFRFLDGWFSIHICWLALSKVFVFCWRPSLCNCGFRCTYYFSWFRFPYFALLNWAAFSFLSIWFFHLFIFALVRLSFPLSSPIFSPPVLRSQTCPTDILRACTFVRLPSSSTQAWRAVQWRRLRTSSFGH